MSNTSLVFIYQKKEIKYEVEGKLSQMGQKFHFINETLGEVVLQKHSESIEKFSIRIDEDYYIFLKRMIKVWKKHFL
jgi:hypothetical protein